MKYKCTVVSAVVLISTFGNISPEVRQDCQGQQLDPTCERRAARVPPEQENPRGHILPTITTAAVTATASMLWAEPNWLSNAT